MKINNDIRIECAVNSTVRSICDGKIISQELGKWGMEIVVENGNFKIHYLGISLDSRLKVGSTIKKGRKLGKTNVYATEPGPALLLRIDFKDIPIDPTMLFSHLHYD